MFDYFAVIWPEEDSGRAQSADSLARVLRRQAPSWQCLLSQPGIRVFSSERGCSGSRHYILDDGRGVILGTLFRAPGTPAATGRTLSLSSKESQAIVDSRGSVLADLYWGRYVAFIRENGKGVSVLRSPTGELDCLTTRHMGLSVFASSIYSCDAVGLPANQINWSQLADSACTRVGESRDTGLVGISRVIHGERVTIRDDETRKEFFWTPFKAARSPAVHVADAARVLRETTRSCVEAWTSQHSSVIEFLSGGLDSSIVLSCLGSQQNRPRIACLNYKLPDDPSTDERHLARLIAGRFGCDLMEHEQTSQFSLRDNLRVPRLDSPICNIYAFAPNEALPRLIHTTQATACFSGEGGDQVFYQNNAALTCMDLLRARGPGRRFAVHAWGSAHVDRKSVWDIVFRKQFRSPLRDLDEELGSRELISQEVRETVRLRKAYLHPWFERAQHVPPGKLWHILGLSFTMGNALYDPTQRIPAEYVLPLLSQPVVELCLQIPTYELMLNQRDRGLAREAFSEDLPREITERFSKGLIQDTSTELLKLNIAYVKELLFDGSLVRERIIDRTVLDEALSSRPTSRMVPSTILLEYAACEAWIDTMRRGVGRAAA